MDRLRAAYLTRKERVVTAESEIGYKLLLQEATLLLLKR